MSIASRYRFGRFEVLPIERKLLVDGRPTVVGGRAFDLLLALIENRGRMLTKDELLDLVWPDVAVEPNNLAVQIGALRKVLGPDSIATIPGRGYCFSATLGEFPGQSMGTRTAASPIAKLKSNLPEEPATLIGRDHELAALDALIDQHAVLTITGAGGIGKSHLAQHLLHRRRDGYAHGVCWVELAAVTDSASLPGALASALGIELGGDGETASALGAVLAPMAMLVALDNAEHLLEDVAALVVTLADAAPKLRLLVTSQVPLHVPREQVFRLQALALPPGPMEAAQAKGYGAVALFVDRARAADARFVFDDAIAPAVIDLCKRLDGLALAIELAAARAPLLGVKRIVHSLDERLQLLTAGKRNAPARQQTLRAALEWSHGLLGARERIVFRRMAVVVGSASLDLVQAIAVGDESCGAASDGLDQWAVVEALSGLVDRSLVASIVEDDNRDRPRYRLLDSPRAYAYERLQEAGEGERLHERHARAIGHLMEAAWEDRWSGRIGADAWRRSVQPDRDNARSALAWALGRGDLPLLLKMAPVLLMRMAPEGAHTDRLVLAETLDRLLAGTFPERPQLLTRTMLALFWHARQAQRGMEEAQRAIALARDANEPFVHYLLLSLVARTAMRLGNAEQAAAALVEMHAIEDPLWPPQRLYWGAEADALCMTTSDKADGAAGLHLWRKTLALGQAAGDSVYAVRSNLVDVELGAGEIDAAVASGTALVALLQLARDEYALLLARANLVAALLAKGDAAAARPVAEAGWAQAIGFDSQSFYADYLTLLAAMQGRWTTAARLAGYATACYARQNSPRWPNEARAFERATGMTRSALGDESFELLSGEGTHLADCQIADLAFGAAGGAG